MKTTTTWTGKMGFIGQNPSGHEVAMDAAEEIGGLNKGSRPTELLLQAVAGCTAIDIVSILNKMRIVPERFDTEVEAERAEEHPRKFTKIHIHYILEGDVPEKKLARAIRLSKDEYCSVSHSLSAEITASYSLNGKQGTMEV
ncbi:OsmC family protein [Salisediminibacterium beveridgei]|uniref:OsmC/Ohr family protein n=1 Tax=Salisediminibacterium beveridgei TaxID=632773 RepID=A0A1D7QVB2_9BACI|nr:OsmC family protein [Salisediminibacterium beveridgei]AOM82942.1 OsmC/Ohr family protein [Salisediminibacterium beveridgei]